MRIIYLATSGRHSFLVFLLFFYHRFFLFLPFFDFDLDIVCFIPVSYTHLRAHETDSYLVCRLLLEKKKKKSTSRKGNTHTSGSQGTRGGCSAETK